MASNKKVNPHLSAKSAVQALLLKYEDPAELAAMLDAYLDDFHRTGPAERDLVEEMVAAKWRQSRVWVIEGRWLQDKIDQHREEDAKQYTGIDEPGYMTLGFARKFSSFQELGRFEARFERAYSRALKNLLLLQRVRRTDQSKSVPQPPAHQNLQNEPSGGHSTPSATADAPLPSDPALTSVRF